MLTCLSDQLSCQLFREACKRNPAQLAVTKQKSIGGTHSLESQAYLLCRALVPKVGGKYNMVLFLGLYVLLDAENSEFVTAVLHRNLLSPM